MTTLYRPVLIESVEQAENLPIGAVSTGTSLPVFVKVDDKWWVGIHGADDDDDERFENIHAVGLTILVPVEAEEETRFLSEEGYDASGRHIGVVHEVKHRYITPWEDA